MNHAQALGHEEVALKPPKWFQAPSPFFSLRHSTKIISDPDLKGNPQRFCWKLKACLRSLRKIKVHSFSKWNYCSIKIRCEGQTTNYFTPSPVTQSCGKSKRWLKEPSAAFILGAAWNLLSLHMMTPCQGCWFKPCQWGSKGSHYHPACHGPTKPSMDCRPWQHPSLPSTHSCFPVSEAGNQAST